MRSLGVPETRHVQVLPPFAVVTIAPPMPTATHALIVGQLIPLSPWLVPEFWPTHVRPPSLLARMVPNTPAA
jgi:hypothetical protein